MYEINTIKIEYINRLTAEQLSELLHLLIISEAEKNSLENWDRSVPFNITTGDGGSDGKITWEGNPTTTSWLKNKFTIFQNKATSLIPSKCAEEILENTKEGEPLKLKSQIKNLVEKDGCYVLFTTQSLTDSGKKEREDAFRVAIKDAGHANSETFQILIYDANKIKDWVNENIAAVILVQRCNGIHRTNGFMTWSEWERYSGASLTNYQSNPILDNYINHIQQSIVESKSLRITGHSGLGKTRLVLEAFRNSELKNSVVYYDLIGRDDIATLKDYLISYQDSQNGIIVIDNCNVSSHIDLSRIIKSNETGALKIITIGLDDSRSLQDLKIILDRNAQRELVKEIIKTKIGETHSPSDIEYLNKISEGYPLMAIQFCESIMREGIRDFSNELEEAFIKRLLFDVGSNHGNEVEYDIIRACSVFSSFGFIDDSFADVINKDFEKLATNQMSFIRTKVYDGTVTQTKFNEICHKFLAKNILEKKGRYIIVKPTILAINLAASWLRVTSKNQIIEIIEELKGVKLEEKFVERLSDLDQLDKAKDIVAELWGPESPFGSAEVLNTSWGSLLFRYVVEVNPIITTKTLLSAFGNQTTEELLEVREGRRNLVWALEKLCFHKETFSTSSKILFSFAAAENETWANNATNQFIHLFQLLLPGTETSLMSRIEVLEWGLKKGDDVFTEIAITAMGRGLNNAHQYSRTGGAEKQGSSMPLKDYRPSFLEAKEYWHKLITMLTPIACSDKSYSELARKNISNSIRSLIRDGEINLIADTIRTIIKAKEDLWPDALNNLKMTLQFETLSTEVVEKINGLIQDLTPSDIKTQLYLKVSIPEWDTFDTNEAGEYIDKAKIRAEELAQKIIEDNITWTDHVKAILTGEQRKGFDFGRKMGELSSNVKETVSLAIEALKTIPKEQQNPEFIAGLIVGANDRSLINETINTFILSEELRGFAFYIVRTITPTLDDINKLFALIDNNGVAIEQFLNFQYGRVLDDLRESEIIVLCKRISAYGKTGKWVALMLIYMYCYQNAERWAANKSFLKELICSENLLIEVESTIRVDAYKWSDTISKILIDERDSEFAKKIADQIVEFCEEDRLGSNFDTYVSNTILLLFDKYFMETWNTLSQAIIGEYRTFFRFENLVNRGGFDNERNGLDFIITEQFLTIVLNWCRTHPIAPKRIAHMMPLGATIDNKLQWHPLSKQIIDHFGEDEEVLDQLHSNMFSFGSMGSRVPYYEERRELVLQLTNHTLNNVKEWANKTLDTLNKYIKIEGIEDAEMDL